MGAVLVFEIDDTLTIDSPDDRATVSDANVAEYTCLPSKPLPSSWRFTG